MALLIFGCSFFDPIRLRFCPLESFAIASTAHTNAPLPPLLRFDVHFYSPRFYTGGNKWLGKSHTTPSNCALWKQPRVWKKLSLKKTRSRSLRQRYSWIYSYNILLQFLDLRCFFEGYIWTCGRFVYLLPIFNERILSRRKWKNDWRYISKICKIQRWKGKEKIEDFERSFEESTKRTANFWKAKFPNFRIHRIVCL